jgi:phosphatidylglycerophosphatase A
MNERVNESVRTGKTVWAWAVGTFFGAGLLRPGPGSWGSAAAALLWLGAAKGLHLAPAPLAWLTLAGAMGALAIGVPAATLVERESERTDPGHVVIDEVAGQWIALIYSRVNLSHLLAGFLFFRLFDILKPWPARQLENMPAGFGIMLDDVAAGVYALLLMLALQHWIG